MLAFCTGLLPAAALVAARDTSELFNIGREIISITFRMAHEIILRMKLIEDTNLSWAVTMVGKNPQQVQPILDVFTKPMSASAELSINSEGLTTIFRVGSTSSEASSDSSSFQWLVDSDGSAVDLGSSYEIF